MNFDDLKSPELQEKLKNVKTPEELIALAKEEGYELSDEQLESAAGGNWCDKFCPHYYDCHKLDSK